LQGERHKAEEIETAEWLKGLLSNGDTRYWGRIFEKYKRPVFARCFSMLQNGEDARDLTSDVFIRAFENIRQYDMKRPFFPWLYRIATNLCIDFIRRNDRVRAMQEKDVENLSDENGPDTLLDNETLKEKIKTAIEKMKSPQKLCFCLFYLQEKSYDEIVQLTGYNHDEVRSHIQNGRRKFKLAFERQV
jgi:RNA polymerase sigma factor (sigma-70 family)